MCGIAGLWTDPSLCIEREPLLALASERLKRRGPDGEGTWCDRDAGVLLGHRRLAIQDLSEAGHQPMISASGRFVISYNGEIYGFRQIRDTLSKGGCRFRGDSDTEVLLAGIEAWGLENALRRIDGMFAFALWDRELRALSFARDRIGEKPLYYGWVDGDLVFASELQALRAAFRLDGIDPDALADYLRFGYVPAPRSMLSNVFKLPPGTGLTLRDRSRPAGFDPAQSPRQYWRVPRPHPSGAPEENTSPEEFSSRLEDAISRQLVSDVPVGSLLSGGIDSTLVTALAQKATPGKLRTFTVGFDTTGYDEARFARPIATHLGTEHTEFTLTERAIVDVVPDLTDILDEPHANPSIVPSFLIARLASSEVTVCLTGDGGDETFAGYNRYKLGEAVWRRIRHIPKGIRHPVGSWLSGAGGKALETILRATPGVRGTQSLHSKAHKFASILSADDAKALYTRLVTVNPDAESLTPCAGRSSHPLLAPDAEFDERHFVQWAMYYDQCSYLPDDNLAKVDRAAMAASMEMRLPLLDRRVFEAAVRLAPDEKLRASTTKHLLREQLALHVPRALFERPKMGFTVPIELWLKTTLREWAEDLMDSTASLEEAALNADAVRLLWRRFLCGAQHEALAVWGVLCLLAWRRAAP